MLWVTRYAVNVDLSIVPEPSRHRRWSVGAFCPNRASQPDAARLDFATVAAYEDDYFPWEGAAYSEGRSLPCRPLWRWRNGPTRDPRPTRGSWPRSPGPRSVRSSHSGMTC